MIINEVKFESFLKYANFSFNKNNIRAIHIPTGIIAECCVDEKSHIANKRKALQLLKEKVMSKFFKVFVNLKTSDVKNHHLNLYLNDKNDFIKTLENNINFDLNKIDDYYIECDDLNIQSEISKIMRKHLDKLQKGL